MFAAASLNGTFTELGTEFEAAHPGATVRFSFDGSAALVDQLKPGAPADVFASADRANMDKAVRRRPDRRHPAGVHHQRAHPDRAHGQPGAAITGLDTSLDGKKLVVCANGVPVRHGDRRSSPKRSASR